MVGGSKNGSQFSYSTKDQNLQVASAGYDKDIGKAVFIKDALGEQLVPNFLPDHQSHFCTFKA